MELRHDFETTGNFLFRWRSYLPLVVIALFFAALSDYHQPLHSQIADYAWEIFCVLISFLGLAIRILTIGFTPKGTSGRNTRQQVAESLNTTGIYSTVRNPLYLGNYFMGLGVSLFAFQWWLPVIFTLIFWLYYERIIFAEEAFLRKKFGRTFTDWAAETPVFWPDFSRYQPANLSFSVRNVLRREYNGFFAVVVLLFLFEVTGDYFMGEGLHFEPAWLGFLAFGFAVWATLRGLKKYTRVLHVEGR